MNPTFPLGMNSHQQLTSFVPRLHIRSAHRFPLSRLATVTTFTALALTVLAIYHAPEAYAQARPAAAAPAETVRPALAAPFKAAQEMIQGMKFREALAKLAEIEAVADRSPYETFLLERFRAAAAVGVRDDAVVVKSFEHVYNSGRLPVAEKLPYSQELAFANYRLKNYKESAAWARRAMDDGSTEPRLRLIQVQALFLADDKAGAAREVANSLKELDAANKTPSEDLIMLQGRIALNMNDDATYRAALERLVLHYPKNDYWADLIARTSRVANFNERYLLDLMRLKMTLGQPLTESNYMFIARASREAGFPIDAQNILNIGINLKVLGTAEHVKFRDTMAKDAADDIKNMARSSAEAAAAKEGPGLFNAGLNYVFNGDMKTGLPMMEQGIKRPGLRRPDDAQLKLGIAYALAGEQAKALEALGAVKGTEGAIDVARLWSLYARKPFKAN